MKYEGIEYVIRASLGRDEWVLLIYYGGNDNPTIVKFSGSRDAANATAHQRIDNWIKRQPLRGAR
jgi:hypothetical protein